MLVMVVVMMIMVFMLVVIDGNFVPQVLLNQETWPTCLVLVSGAKEHHSKSLVILFKLLRDGKNTK